jgi:hypothetical protein
MPLYTIYYILYTIYRYCSIGTVSCANEPAVWFAAWSRISWVSRFINLFSFIMPIFESYCNGVFMQSRFSSESSSVSQLPYRLLVSSSSDDILEDFIGRERNTFWPVLLSLLPIILVSRPKRFLLFSFWISLWAHFNYEELLPKLDRCGRNAALINQPGDYIRNQFSLNFAIIHPVSVNRFYVNILFQRFLCLSHVEASALSY